MSPLKLGILISGRGSNMESVIKHCKENTIDANVEVVISNRGSAKGLEVAQNNDIHSHHIKFKDFDNGND
jgi:Folate-dependent phosphoribosylglycinamide formyltransferase PurN